MSNQLYTNTLIVGAGLSGLCIAEQLQRVGSDYIIVDANSKIGSSWAVRHPQLRLNTHKIYSTMPDLAYPSSARSFPTRDDVIGHLTRFATLKNISPKFNTNVRSVSQDACGLFHITTDSENIEAKHIVFCTGLDGTPKSPHIAGIERFTGIWRHARDLGDVQQYCGKSVLVIGAGNSGFDLLNNLVKVDIEKLALSVRGTSPVLPKRIFGLSTHLLAPAIAMMPSSISNMVVALTQYLAFGSLSKLNFPKPANGGASRLAEGRAIAVDDGTIAAVKNGQVIVVPEIGALYEEGAITIDGQKLEVDVIIYATGYVPGISGIEGLAGFVDSDGRAVTDRFGQSSFNKNIWFAGHYPTAMSFFHTAKFQAKHIARSIARA